MNKNFSFFFLFTISCSLFGQEEVPAYYEIAVLNNTIEEAVQQVKETLEEDGFQILGEYQPGEMKDLYVLAFSRKDLQDVSLKVKDRGALAAVMKVGFVQSDQKVMVSLLNPDYVFYAYLMENSEKYNGTLKKISSEVKQSLKKIGKTFRPFGGEEDREDLYDYHYMMMMPYFTDPVELKEFSSFNAGVSIIQKNLNVKKGNTRKVYEMIFEDHQVAVFGIALYDEEDGESVFLPIIGKENIAAMPYEIILQGNIATMLPGRYRFALHWPELSMSEFMKIVNTPGDVEEFLEALCE